MELMGGNGMVTPLVANLSFQVTAPLRITPAHLREVDHLMHDAIGGTVWEAECADGVAITFGPVDKLLAYPNHHDTRIIKISVTVRGTGGYATLSIGGTFWNVYAFMQSMEPDAARILQHKLTATFASMIPWDRPLRGWSSFKGFFAVFFVWMSWIGFLVLNEGADLGVVTLRMASAEAPATDSEMSGAPLLLVMFGIIAIPIMAVSRALEWALPSISFIIGTEGAAAERREYALYGVGVLAIFLPFFINVLSAQFTG